MHFDQRLHIQKAFQTQSMRDPVSYGPARLAEELWGAFAPERRKCEKWTPISRMPRNRRSGPFAQAAGGGDDGRVFGKADAATLAQAERCALDAEAMLLMADNHKGYGMPVGGVAVYKDREPPARVGFDIACGNKVVLTNLRLGEIEGRLSRLADGIFASLSFGVGRKNTTAVGHRVFDDPAWDEVGILKNHPVLKKKELDQLGTIGCGNRYVDVFADEADRILVGAHFGSRGLGHALATQFMKRAGDNPNIVDETPNNLEVGSRHGRDYIRAMRLAGDYAYAGRDWVCETVVGILGGKIIEEVHNHHNLT